MVKSLQMYRALAAVLGLGCCRAVPLCGSSPGGARDLYFRKAVDFETTRSLGVAEPLKVRLPFLLGFYTAPDYPKYRIEIVDDHGKSCYSRDTTLPEGFIPLRRDFLSPGDYDFRLSGLQGRKIRANRQALEARHPALTLAWEPAPFLVSVFQGYNKHIPSCQGRSTAGEFAAGGPVVQLPTSPGDVPECCNHGSRLWRVAC